MVGPLTPGPDVEAPDGDPLVVGVDDERADEVLSALSATTTRRVLAALHEDPAPPSALADRLDTSLQNVDYHLRKLLEASLVEAAGIAYSEKGREMTVYAPADRALVFVASPEPADDADGGLVATLQRLLGGVGVLGLASVAVERLLAPTARWSGSPDTGYATNQSGTALGGAGAATGDAGAATGSAGTETDGAGTATDDAEPTADGAGTVTNDAGGASTATEAAQTSAGQSSATEAVTGTAREAATTVTQQSTSSPEATRSATGVAQSATEAATTAVDAGAVDALAASPGLLFFLGGLTALLLAALVRRRR